MHSQANKQNNIRFIYTNELFISFLFSIIMSTCARSANIGFIHDDVIFTANDVGASSIALGSIYCNHKLDNGNVFASDCSCIRAHLLMYRHCLHYRFHQ